MLSKVIKYFLISILFCVFGCSQQSGKEINFDKAEKLEPSSERNFILAGDNAKTPISDEIFQGMFVPEMSDMLAFPEPPKFTQGNQIISFSVTQNVDLKDVLIELSRVSGLEIDIDPKISGGIIINARNRPLTEVIDRICNLGNIRYEFKNGVLTFYNDYSFAKHYLVNYLAESSLWSDVQANLRNILKSVSKNNTSITLNKSAGIVTVFANQKGQKAIKSYLDKVKRISSSQVLLEAKVVEVSLSDEYSAGIDWSILDSNGNGTKVLGSEAASTFDEGNPAAAVFSVAGSSVFGGDGKMTISALEKFGEVKAVSSPRISTLHNRKAKLDFIDKLIYFTISTDSTTDTSGSSGTVVSESVSAEMHEEPVGVELSITPSIDLKNNEITLEVNPKLSINSGEVAKDPSVGSDGENLGNEIPIIQTREIKTFAKIKSGDTLVVGGLMKESVNNNETAVPFLSDIPFIGNLFKYVNKSTSMVETVIFIKATIVDSASGLNRFDQRFHNKFLKTRNNILK